MITWSNHDKAAFNDWLNTDLGAKFLAYLRQSRPAMEVSLDINSMAMRGAIFTGYEQAITLIEQMRFISAPKNVEPLPYVRDTHKD
jgi:hypothetical protein